MAGELKDLLRELSALPEGDPVRVAGERLIEIETARMKREEALRTWELRESGYLK